MTSIFQKSLAPLAALGLLLASSASAQTPAPDPHHPADAPADAAPAVLGITMPMMGGGMMPMMNQMMGGGMMGMMGMGGGMMAMMHRHPDGYFAFLKTEIGITGVQTTVWDAYAGQMRALLKKHMDAVLMMPDPGATPRTWIERLADNEARLSEHLEAMKKIRPAATALYAALTPEQKNKADELMPLMPGAAGMKMGLRREGK